VGEFGDKFRKAREKKEISLDDVSKVTKIGTRMLQAIEAENFDQLPGGVFNKGFIRAFAKCVGLDEQEAINEYLETLRRAQADALAAEQEHAPAAGNHAGRMQPAATAQPSQVAAARSDAKKDAPAKGTPQNATAVEDMKELHLPRIEDVRRPRKSFADKRAAIPWRLVVAALLVVALGSLLWQRHLRRAEAVHNVTAAPPIVAAPASTGSSSTGNDSANAASATKPKEVTPPVGEVKNVQQPSPVVPANATSPAPNEPDVTTRGRLPAALPALGAKTPAPFTLIIRANENSWISVTADGQTVSQETLIAPAVTSVHARHEIVAKIGNTAGVTFVWNGQQIQPEGTESEVKTFVFDASGMRVAAAGQAPQAGIP
jgi:cytoskeletal protein RodZ